MMRAARKTFKHFSLLILTIALVSIPLNGSAFEQGEDFKASWYRWDKEYWPSEPVRGGTLHTAAKMYIGLMNPHHWPVNDWVAIGYFYELMVYNDGNYKPGIPWLMRTWKYEDPVTVITTLQKEVRFHDGTLMDAEAVRYNVEWIRNKKSGAFSRGYFRPLKSVEVLDEYTLKWTFNKPWAGFVGTVGYVLYILSKQALMDDEILREAKARARYVKKAEKKLAKAEKKAGSAASKGEAAVKKAAAKVKKAKKALAEARAENAKVADKAKQAKNTDTNPIGTGPFILEEARPGNYLKVRRNPNWWFGRSIGRPDMPYYDGIKITVIPDPAIQLANLRAGEIDISSIDKAQYEMVKDNPKLNVYVSPGSFTAALYFNHAKGPCRDIRVRKAISHAIDRKALVNGTQFGFGVVASGIYPKRHHARNPDLKPVTYDPALSKKLLIEAGYADGLKIKGHMGNSVESVTLTEALKAMLAEVGIIWKVDSLDPAASSDRLMKLEYDICEGGWSYIFDPDTVATGLYHPKGGFNFGRSNNKKAIALIDAGIQETDEVKRIRIYQELDKVLYDNYEDAWLWYYTGITAHRKVVQGFNHKMYMDGGEGYIWSHPNWFKKGKRQ
jgi:ABC-type transport system substrate-binding protein